MRHLFLALAVGVLTIAPLLAEDNKDEKKAEKIDPAKLVGEWKSKKLFPIIPFPLLDVYEFTKKGEANLTHAQPDDLASGALRGAGTYKVDGSKVELTMKTYEWPEKWGGKSKPTPDAKPQTWTIEVVKLTDTELHLKLPDDLDINHDGLREYVRVTTDDKDTSVDTAKLVGRWKTKVPGLIEKVENVRIAEYTKDGKVTVLSAPATDLTRAVKLSEGTYTLKDKKLTETLKPDKDKEEGGTFVWEIIKLTDTGLTFRDIDEKSKERGYIPGMAWGYERVKEEKKEK